MADSRPTTLCNATPIVLNVHGKREYPDDLLFIKNGAHGENIYYP